MSLLVVGVYLLEKISSFLSCRDLAHLELSCKTLSSQLEEAGVWKASFRKLSRKYQYGFILDTARLEAVEGDGMGEEKFYKLLTGLILITSRSFKKYFQCCFWEEKSLDVLGQGSQSTEFEDIDEISIKELLFTRGDSLVLKNCHLVIEDPDFPGLGLVNSLKVSFSNDLSKFLSRFRAWIEVYFKYIDKYLDVLREQVFLIH